MVAFTGLCQASTGVTKLADATIRSIMGERARPMGVYSHVHEAPTVV